MLRAKRSPGSLHELQILLHCSSTVFLNSVRPHTVKKSPGSGPHYIGHPKLNGHTLEESTLSGPHNAGHPNWNRFWAVRALTLRTEATAIHEKTPTVSGPHNAGHPNWHRFWTVRALTLRTEATAGMISRPAEGPLQLAAWLSSSVLFPDRGTASVKERKQCILDVWQLLCFLVRFS